MKPSHVPRPVAVLLPVLLVAMGCRKGPEQAGPPPSPELVFPVTVGTVTRGAITQNASVTGTVRWPLQVMLKSEVAGRVVSLAVQEGESFGEDAVLVQVDARDYEIQQHRLERELEKAQRELERLRTGTRPEVIAASEALVAQMVARTRLTADELERTRKLFEEKVRSQSELTRSEASHAEAEARLAEAKARLGEAQNGPTRDEFLIAESVVNIAGERVRLAERDAAKCEVRAPFAGTVLTKSTQIGAYVTPGEPLLEIASPAETEVMIELAERHVELARQVTSFTVVADAIPGVTFAATVAAIVPRADSVSRNFQLRARVEDAGGRLLPGMFLRGQLPLAHRDDALLVPRDAVTLEGTDKVVFVVEDAAARLVPVHVGLTSGEHAEVVGDLQAGDEVVTTGGEVLFPGAKVMDTAKARPGRGEGAGSDGSDGGDERGKPASKQTGTDTQE